MAEGWCPFVERIPGVSTYAAGGNELAGWCDHTAGGFLSTMRNPSFWNNAGYSVHFAEGLDGAACQLVGIFDRAWGQGKDANGNSVGPSSPGVTYAPFATMGKRNPNEYLISTEHEDYRLINGKAVAQPPIWSPPMYDIDLRIKRWCVEEAATKRGIDLLRFGFDSFAGHFMFDPRNRAGCPGSYWQNEYRLRLFSDLTGGDDVFTVLAYGKYVVPLIPAGGISKVQEFGLPLGAKRVRLQVWVTGGPVEFYHGLADTNNRDAGRVYAPYGIVEVIPAADGGFYTVGEGTIEISPLGYYT